MPKQKQKKIKRMKYKDLFTSENGLFQTVFKKDFESYYFELFGDLNPEVLDAHAIYHYGDRELVSKVDSNSYKYFLRSYININFNVWKSKKNILSLEYDIRKPVNSVRTRTDNISVNNNSINEALQGAKAFNQDEFKDSERTKNTDEATKEERHVIQDSTSGTGANYDIIANLEKEINFKKQNFYREVIKDINNFLTLQVY